MNTEFFANKFHELWLLTQSQLSETATYIQAAHTPTHPSACGDFLRHDGCRHEIGCREQGQLRAGHPGRQDRFCEGAWVMVMVRLRARRWPSMRDTREVMGEV